MSFQPLFKLEHVYNSVYFLWDLGMKSISEIPYREILILRVDLGYFN